MGCGASASPTDTSKEEPKVDIQKKTAEKKPESEIRQVLEEPKVEIKKEASEKKPESEIRRVLEEPKAPISEAEAEKRVRSYGPPRQGWRKAVPQWSNLTWNQRLTEAEKLLGEELRQVLIISGFEHLDVAEEWCKEKGVATKAKLLDQQDVFCKDLQLKELQRTRLCRACGSDYCVQRLPKPVAESAMGTTDITVSVAMITGAKIMVDVASSLLVSDAKIRIQRKDCLTNRSLSGKGFVLLSSGTELLDSAVLSETGIHNGSELIAMLRNNPSTREVPAGLEEVMTNAELAQFTANAVMISQSLGALETKDMQGLWGYLADSLGLVTDERRRLFQAAKAQNLEDIVGYSALQLYELGWTGDSLEILGYISKDDFDGDFDVRIARGHFYDNMPSAYVFSRPEGFQGVDVGVFGQHVGTPGKKWLESHAELPSKQEVRDLISKLGGRPGSSFTEMKSSGMKGWQEAKSYVDQAFGSAKEAEDDFKISMSPRETAVLIGSEQFQKLLAIFGSSPDEILMRRSQALGQCINFHTDHSAKTMQVALNSEEEYVGGRLVYATDDGLQIPRRSMGTITLHHNDIVHGVTKLEKGVRYGLFFLKKSIC